MDQDIGRSYTRLPSDPNALAKLLGAYPESLPKLLFRAEGRYSVLALAWQVYSGAQAEQLMASIPVCSQRRPTPTSQQPASPWGLGWFGVLDYDSYSARASGQKANEQWPDGAAARGRMPPLLARLYRSLVFDHDLGSCTLVAEADCPAGAIQLEPTWDWQQVLRSQAASAHTAANPLATESGVRQRLAGLRLQPSRSDGDYLTNVRSVLADIKKGRFYQLNLLRYFSAEPMASLEPLATRFLRFYEPYSLWFRWQLAEGQDAELLSFSPERFVAILPRGGDGTLGAGLSCAGSKSFLIAEPIKGTMGRRQDKAADQRQRQALLASTKDLAELHMIVDLLRHDMWPLCQPQSIRVVKAHQLRSFQRVHHLVATIEGQLKPQLTLEDCWAALLPAGSITGTPKREVIEAIQQLEQRPRGLFMGVAFHCDPMLGSLDSSVLIRTIVRRGQSVDYAAGSGLVIHSSPEQELAEISQKCRVVTDQLGT